MPLVHEGEEGGIVLSGRIEVTVDDERRILGLGMRTISKAGDRTDFVASGRYLAR